MAYLNQSASVNVLEQRDLMCAVVALQQPQHDGSVAAKPVRTSQRLRKGGFRSTSLNASCQVKLYDTSFLENDTLARFIGSKTSILPTRIRTRMKAVKPMITSLCRSRLVADGYTSCQQLRISSIKPSSDSSARAHPCPDPLGQDTR